eukprot:c24452_g1_i1 orf=526-2094(+)
MRPNQNLCSRSISIPIFKSKAVIEAEKTMAGTYTKALGTRIAQNKAMSMNDLTLYLEDMNSGSDEQEECEIAESLSKIGSKPSLTAHDTKPELVETAHKAEALRKKHLQRLLRRTFSRVWQEARIDLDASPATKLWLQVMPLELTPPLTPPKTPAAVPFVWEETPGKPKIVTPPPLPSLHLPPRLLSVPPRMGDGLFSCPSHSSGKSSTPRETYCSGCQHRSHSWHPLQNLLSTNRHSSQENSAAVYKTDEEAFRVQPSASLSENEILRKIKSSSSQDSPVTTLHCREDSCSSSSSSNAYESLLLHSLLYGEDKFIKDHRLPSPYVCFFTPLSSPYRDLGPTNDEIGFNCRGFKAFVKNVSKVKWSPWTKCKQKKIYFPASEPWAPTLATYFHRLKQHNHIYESKDSLLENGDSDFFGIISQENISTENRRERPSNNKLATSRHTRDPVRQEEEICEKQRHCKEIPRFEVAYPVPISRPRKGRRPKGHVILGRLRKGSRFFVAAVRSLFGRKGYKAKLMGDS